MRPTNAVTPSMWTRHSVSDDFQVAAPGWVAGICGVVTTQPWGIDSPETIEDGHTTLAPLYATNSFLLGTSDFWVVTNESSKTFVWKDIAFNRDPSNLVSFAATIYEWVDGSSQTNQFTTNVQTFRLFANGDAEVLKFGWTAHRGTNGVQTVAREAQP